MPTVLFPASAGSALRIAFAKLNGAKKSLCYTNQKERALKRRLQVYLRLTIRTVSGV